MLTVILVPYQLCVICLPSQHFMLTFYAQSN
uniref:Uncharacterized protein n=1 Tax=Anguilla anguilla TaxID=7936 RepID=A0A0E9Q2X9_ANGAN